MSDKGYKSLHKQGQNNTTLFPVLLLLTEKLFVCRMEIIKMFSIVSGGENCPHQKATQPQHERNNNPNIYELVCARNSFPTMNARSLMSLMMLISPLCFFSSSFYDSQRARQSTCIDPVSGKRTPFLEIFPEDLLCHASALSSLGLTLKFKYLVLHLSALSIFSWKTFHFLCV